MHMYRSTPKSSAQRKELTESEKVGNNMELEDKDVRLRERRR